MEAAPPPPLQKSAFAHKAALFSVLAPFVSMVINAATGSARYALDRGGYHFISVLIEVIVLAFMALAIPAGIIALCGIRKYGKERLLWQGTVGIVVTLLIISVGYLALRNHKAERDRPVHSSS